MTTTNDSGTNLDHLEACPFCGSMNLSIETNSVQPDNFHDAWVNCGECNADGRHAMTLEGWLPSKAEAKQEAVVAWNRRAALPNQPAPTVPEPVAAVRRWCKGDAEWTNWKFVDAAEYVRRKDDDAFQVVVLAHQPAQEQADETTPSVDHRNTYVLLHGYTAQQEPVAAPEIMYSAPITVSSMTLRKREFLEQKGYSVVGYVMQDAKNERCTVAHGNVMWGTVSGKD